MQTQVQNMQIYLKTLDKTIKTKTFDRALDSAEHQVTAPSSLEPI